jgi:Ion channel
LSLLDAVYMASVTYTTVGFGDLAPVGAVRFLAGTIALTGFVLIGWSASFTYLEMSRDWR